MEMALNILKRVRSDGPLVLIRTDKMAQRRHGAVGSTDIHAVQRFGVHAIFGRSLHGDMVQFEKRLKFDTYSPENILRVLTGHRKETHRTVRIWQHLYPPSIADNQPRTMNRPHRSRSARQRFHKPVGHLAEGGYVSGVLSCKYSSKPLPIPYPAIIGATWRIRWHRNIGGGGINTAFYIVHRLPFPLCARPNRERKTFWPANVPSH